MKFILCLSFFGLFGLKIHKKYLRVRIESGFVKISIRCLSDENSWNARRFGADDLVESKQAVEMVKSNLAGVNFPRPSVESAFVVSWYKNPEKIPTCAHWQWLSENVNYVSVRWKELKRQRILSGRPSSKQ